MKAVSRGFMGAAACIAACWASGCELVVGPGNYSSEDDGGGGAVNPGSSASSGAATGSGSGSSGSSGASSSGAAGASSSGSSSGSSGGHGGSGSGGSGSGGSSGDDAGSSGGTGAAVGYPCTGTTGCQPGLTCNGAWCTEDCTTASTCGVGALGIADLCGPTFDSTSDVCFPGCDPSNDQCAASFTGTQCISPPSFGGSICAAPGEVGDECAAGANECDTTVPLTCGNPSTTTGTPPTGGFGWCYNANIACTEDSDCAGGGAGGANDTGGTNHCVYLHPTGTVCAPACTTEGSGGAGSECPFTGTSCEFFSTYAGDDVLVCGETD
jgi:hypothetical protein